METVYVLIIWNDDETREETGESFEIRAFQDYEICSVTANQVSLAELSWEIHTVPVEED